MTLFEQRPGDGLGVVRLPPPPSRRWRWFLAVVVAIAVVVGVVGGGAFGLAAAISSWIGPQPLPADVAAVADRALLTPRGREVIMTAGVRSAAGDDLRRACSVPGAPPDHVFAGCFSAAGIVVFIPADARVADSAVTTLDHEMLHAAFETLRPADRVHVVEMLRAAADQVPADDPVRAQIEASVAGREEVRDTELFAYLGTQVRPDGGFDPALEDVYARFLADRAALVELGRRVDDDVHRLMSDYESAAQSLIAEETAAAEERVRLETDRGAHETDRRRYQEDADRYNAMDAVQRAGWRATWPRPDGTVMSDTWSAVLAVRRADLEARRLDIETRQAALDAAVADDTARRAAVEAQYDDVRAVLRALDPGQRSP